MNNAVALHTVVSLVSPSSMYCMFFSCCPSLLLMQGLLRPHHPHRHIRLDHKVVPCMPSDDLYTLGMQKTSYTYKPHAYIQSKQTRQYTLAIKQKDAVPIALPFWFISLGLSFVIFFLPLLPLLPLVVPLLFDVSVEISRLGVVCLRVDRRASVGKN